MRNTIGYGTHGYISHARAATAYRSILRTRYTVVDNVATAQEMVPLACVIIHAEPLNYRQIYDQYRELETKYVISYSVWEASNLPPIYAESLALVQEVWTCSEYCKAIISQAHDNVHCIPHIIDNRPECSRAQIEEMRVQIGLSDKDFVFLNISASGDKRKNLGDLIAGFRLVADSMPGARLLLKTPVPDLTASGFHDRITWMPGFVSDEQITALYHLSHVYVSPHHSEGWGLTLSDAMLLGKPTIATNYSGNLQFMSPSNSFLVSYEERDIKEEDCFYQFTSDMKWAYPSVEDLAGKLLLTYNNYHDPIVEDKIKQAKSDIRRYSASRVAPLIFERLDKIIG